MSIFDNYNRIREEIARISNASGRNIEDIKIIAVSKTIPVNIIQEAVDSGIKIYGENKIQEAVNKIPKLKGDFIFHMIGHLQSNKAKEAVKYFDIIHSIDKVDTAIKVNNEAEKLNKVQKILVQINSSGEETKSGILPEQAVSFLGKVMDLKNIELLGLMTMAPFTENQELIRNSFRTTKKLLDEINNTLHTNLNELSMGMSSDYKIAVEEGATMVRIGTALFGERIYT